MDTTAHASTVDAQEYAHYDRLADTWWDESGPFWPLHKLNALRVRWLRDMICAHFGLDASRSRPLAGLDMLDIGCGGGILTMSLAELGATVHGIDVVERNIATARRHVGKLSSVQRVSFEAISAERLAAEGKRYDVVLSMEVVEHVSDLDTFLASNCALVAPGGALFLSTINRTLRSFLFAIIGAEYVLGWLPRGTHRWRKFPRPRELEERLARHDFVTLEATGVGVNPFTRRFSLTGSMAVNYMLMAGRDLGEGGYLVGGARS